MPRITSLQKNRSNTPAVTAQEYYRRNLAFPFLEHIIVQLESRLSGLSKQSASLLGLVPSVMCRRDSDISEAANLYESDLVMCRKDTDISEAANLYESDLPSQELLQSELIRWKQKFVSLQPDQRPSSCTSALKKCDKDFFPNAHVFLRIACTLPCRSCECERSFIVMRRLRTYMRCSMSDDRLTSVYIFMKRYIFYFKYNFNGEFVFEVSSMQLLINLALSIPATSVQRKEFITITTTCRKLKEEQ